MMNDEWGTPTRVLIALSFLVGTAFGAAECVRAIHHTTSISFLQVTLLLLDGCLAYGSAAAILTVFWLTGRRLFRNSGVDGSVAVGIAIGMGFTIHFIYALAKLHEPKLAWLIPGCILMGAVFGSITRWISWRFPFLQERFTWILLSCVIVLSGFGLFIRGSRAGSPGKSDHSMPNVLLISVDTLRSDKLGCYGYKAARTPVIDQLAAQGVLFEQATSHVPLTGPAHATMLTGLYPDHHGAVVNGVAIRGDVRTVPEILSTMGYRTAAFVSGWTLKNASVGLAGRFGLYDEDFARWNFLPDIALKLPLLRLAVTVSSLSGYEIDPLERPGERTTTRALEWLSHHHDQPFFLFVHYFDPHAPYSPPSRYAKMHDPDYRGDPTPFRFSLPQEVKKQIVSDPQRVQHMKAMYDGEISYVDEEVGRLLKALESLNLTENTLVVFTADHGESQTEHNFFFDHGEFLYETCIRVPLIFRFPRGKYSGIRWNKQIRMVDLAPTILRAVGLKQMPSLDGLSLLPILDGSESNERISFASVHSALGESRRSRYAVRENGYKLIWNFDLREELNDLPASEELYDLTTDPEELKNQIVFSPAPLDGLRAKLQEWLRHNRQGQSGLSEEVRERLRALGYLQ